MSAARKYRRRNERANSKVSRPPCPRCSYHRNPKRCLMDRRVDLGAYLCRTCGWQLPLTPPKPKG